MTDAMSSRSRSSGITSNACDLSLLLDQEETSTMDLSRRESMSSDWTDEKHSMYLKSMEASFVNQLYSSMNSNAWLTHEECHPHTKSTKHTEACTPNEFKVHQYCSQQRIKSDNGEPAPQEAKDCRFRQGKQWIQHYRVGIRKYHIVRENTSDRNPILNSSSVGQEVSDQNFDEDNEEGQSGIHATKRAKIAKSSSSKYPVKEFRFGRTCCSDLSLHSSSTDGQIGKDWQTSTSNS